MKGLSKTSRYLIISIGVIQAVLLVVGLLVILFAYPFAPPLAFAVGMVAGGLFSCWRVWQMERGFKRTVEMEQEKADNYGKAQFLLRYVASIVFLVAVFLLRKWVSPIGAIIGILALQLASFVVNIWLNKEEKKDPDNFSIE